MGEADELFALKRIHLDRGALTSELHFAAPDEPGEYLYSVRLVSDSYIGLEGAVQVTVRRLGLRRRCVSCIAPGARASA